MAVHACGVLLLHLVCWQQHRVMAVLAGQYTAQMASGSTAAPSGISSTCMSLQHHPVAAALCPCFAPMYCTRVPHTAVQCVLTAVHTVLHLHGSTVVHHVVRTHVLHHAVHQVLRPASVRVCGQLTSRQFLSFDFQTAVAGGDFAKWAPGFRKGF